MKQFQQEILHQLRKNIIDDLDIENDILKPLLCMDILNRVDVESIYTGATKEERAEKLLDILPRYVYTFFCFICAHVLIFHICFYINCYLNFYPIFTNK